MSDDGGQGRSWHLYVGDMIEFCESVLSFTDGMNQAEFVADRRTYHATLHSLQLIGEAATHIPADVRDTHSEIRWREIIGTRNRIVHAYLGMTTMWFGTSSRPISRIWSRNCVTFEAHHAES